MSGNTRRSLQGRILYKTIDALLSKFAPRVTQRPIVEVVIQQEEPIRVLAKRMGSGDYSVKMVFREQAIAGLPEKIEDFKPVLIPQVRKLAEFLMSLPE